MAALLVVAFHAIEAWRDHAAPADPVFWANGAAGVDVFFVVSGLVMTIGWQRSALQDTWQRFLRGRLARIVPLYWLCSAVKCAAVTAAPVLAAKTRLSIGYVASSFLFLPLHDTFGRFKPLLPVGWTLTFEMLFYALFAAGLALHMPSPMVLVPILVAMTLVPHQPGSVIGEISNPIIVEFGFGVLIASLRLRRREAHGWPAAALLGVSIVLLLSLPRDFAGTRTFAWGVPAALLVASVVVLEPWLARSLPKLVLQLGNASYAIYLTHGFVLPVLAGALTPAYAHGLPSHFILGLFISGALVASSLIGYAVHILVEQPMVNFFKPRRRSTIKQ